MRCEPKQFKIVVKRIFIDIDIFFKNLYIFFNNSLNKFKIRINENKIRVNLYFKISFIIQYINLIIMLIDTFENS